MTATQIREDLKNIRYFYIRKDMFEKTNFSVGKNKIADTIERYNNAICFASPRLYDVYVSLYIENNTQESLSDKLGYSLVYISKLNSQLIKFFQKQLEIKEEN